MQQRLLIVTVQRLGDDSADADADADPAGHTRLRANNTLMAIVRQLCAAWVPANARGWRPSLAASPASPASPMTPWAR